MLHQQGHVVSALREGWHVDWNHGQPVVQVFAKLPLGDGFLQVFVGGRKDPHVDRNVLVAAHPCDFVLLERPQHLGLRTCAHVPHLVQEQRPSIGLLKFALSHGHGASERTLFVAKQLALDQLRRDGRAIDFHERPLCPFALVVQLPCDELLAGTVATRDEHPGVGGSDGFNHVKHLPNALRLPNDCMGLRLMHLLLEHLRLRNQVSPLKHVPKGDQHTVQVQWLLNEVVRPLFEGLHGGVHRSVA